MSETSPETSTPQADPAPVAEVRPEDKPLGEGGVKALQAERDARQTAESALRQLRKDLASLTGGDSQSSDPVAALADRFSTLESDFQAAQRAVLVRDLARDNGISDPDDIALMESATDDATLQRLVARLKANTPAVPRPDPTQGGSSAPVALNGDGLEQALRDKLGI